MRISNGITSLIAGLSLMFSGSFSCSLFYVLDDNYYYNPWNAVLDSKHCMAIDTNNDQTTDASLIIEMSIANSVMTKTKKIYSDTACAALDATIVSTSSFVTGAYVDATIIYLDISTGDYLTWSNQPVSALTVEITYDTATLTCSSDSCVTNYTGLIALNNCSSGTLTLNTSYDYAACEFAGKPATEFTLAYRNSFKDLIFGTSHVLSSESGDLAGDSADTRQKYLLANERYSLQ